MAVQMWCGCGARARARVRASAPEADEVDSVDAVAGGREGGHVAPPVEARGAEAVDEQKGLPVLRAGRDVVDSERRRLAPVWKRRGLDLERLALC
mgnify:CR=1 FL=1